MKNKVNKEKEMYMVFASRRIVCILLLIIQSLILLYILLGGPQGYQTLLKARQATKVLGQGVEKNRHEIQNLILQVQEWKTSLFLKEKYAREKLHMGKKDEQVFLYE